MCCNLFIQHNIWYEETCSWELTIHAPNIRQQEWFVVGCLLWLQDIDCRSGSSRLLGGTLPTRPAPVHITLWCHFEQPTNNSTAVISRRVFLHSPVSQQGALFGAAVCSPSGQHPLGLQHHHLRFFQEAPSIVDSNMEPSFLDNNRPECAIWSWLLLRIIRTTINKSSKIN